MRILVVDDFVPWRRFVSSLLREAGWHVVGEVSDGSEAIQKVQELQPDLVTLDIWLPTLDGIHAARQIRKVARKSKILFLSLSDSLDVVLEALNTGAAGYVVKLDAARELRRAVEAVSQGSQFLSRRLRGLISLDGAQAGILAGHRVQLYSDDLVLLDRATEFIGAALKVGNPAVVVATKGHRVSLCRRLTAQGVDIDTLIEQGAYALLDAADMLSTFMVDDRPDPALFFQGVKTAIESASKAAKAEHPRVAIFGEAGALLCARAKAEEAIRLEQVGNELSKAFNVDILCAYPFNLQEDMSALRAICRQHSAVHWE
jgi:two-component system, chemotaxis family, chemotaxis protein CheY